MARARALLLHQSASASPPQQTRPPLLTSISADQHVGYFRNAWRWSGQAEDVSDCSDSSNSTLMTAAEVVPLVVEIHGGGGPSVVVTQ